MAPTEPELRVSIVQKSLTGRCFRASPVSGEDFEARSEFKDFQYVLLRFAEWEREMPVRETDRTEEGIATWFELVAADLVSGFGRWCVVVYADGVMEKPYVRRAVGEGLFNIAELSAIDAMITRVNAVTVVESVASSVEEVAEGTSTRSRKQAGKDAGKGKGKEKTAEKGKAKVVGEEVEKAVAKKSSKVSGI